MTAYEELEAAVVEAPCLRHQKSRIYNCTDQGRKHTECATAALLRKLATSKAVKDGMAMAWTGMPYGLGNQNSVDAICDFFANLVPEEGE